MPVQQRVQHAQRPTDELVCSAVEQYSPPDDYDVRFLLCAMAMSHDGPQVGGVAEVADTQMARIELGPRGGH